MEQVEKSIEGASSASRVITDAVCTRCSCLCDDLSLVVEGQRITEISPPCPLAQPWFLAQRGDAVSISRVQGKVVTEEAAVAAAAQLLHDAQAPLVYGLTECATNGQRSAVALADRLGARLDIPASPTANAALAAFQTAGASMSTLGEVRERADLVIYWGCHPMVTHPRHVNRFVEATGRWVPDGRKGRHVISIQSAAGSSADEFADTTIMVDPCRDGEVIAMMRSMLEDGNGADLLESRQSVAGVAVESLRDLVERMQSCKYGVIFYGDQISGGQADVFTLHAVHRLAAELNAFSRFTVRHLIRGQNAMGAANVATWQTGYPNNVNFASGYPCYEPVESSLESLLGFGDVDALMVVGAEAIPALSASAMQRLKRIPTVVVSHVNSGGGADWSPVVHITTGTPSIHSAGVAYRMDDVPLPLRPVFDSKLPTDEFILGKILDALSSV